MKKLALVTGIALLVLGGAVGMAAAPEKQAVEAPDGQKSLAVPSVDEAFEALLEEAAVCSEARGETARAGSGCCQKACARACGAGAPCLCSGCQVFACG